MLTEIPIPEKSVEAASVPELREILEAGFQTTYTLTVLDRIEIKPDGMIEFDRQRMPCTQSFLEARSHPPHPLGRSQPHYRRSPAV